MKILRRALAGILFRIATIIFLLFAGGSTTFAQTTRHDAENWAPLKAQPGFELNRKNRAAWDSSIDSAFARRELQASGQGSSNTSGALPQTYTEWKEQNAANEKSSHSVETLGYVLIAALGVLALFKWWYSRR